MAATQGWAPRAAPLGLPSRPHQALSLPALALTWAGPRLMASFLLSLSSGISTCVSTMPCPFSRILENRSPTSCVLKPTVPKYSLRHDYQAGPEANLHGSPRDTLPPVNCTLQRLQDHPLQGLGVASVPSCSFSNICPGRPCPFQGSSCLPALTRFSPGPLVPCPAPLWQPWPPSA